MNSIPIKPFSVNQSYQGMRFSTPKLKAYRTLVSAASGPLIFLEALSSRYLLVHDLCLENRHALPRI